MKIQPPPAGFSRKCNGRRLDFMKKQPFADWILKKMQPQDDVRTCQDDARMRQDDVRMRQDGARMRQDDVRMREDGVRSPPTGF